MINICKWQKLKTWNLWYIWNTYLSPHIKYGALIFYKENDRGEFDKENPAFLSLQKIFHQSIKKLLDLPSHTSHLYLE